jgi:DNA-directed RNA polymerase subunit RPC12/RpoP
MKTVRCPYCENHMPIADNEWGTTVECVAPGCGRFFLSGFGMPGWQPPEPTPTPAPRPARPSEPEPPRPHPREPLLTGPHRCLVCAGEIHTPYGLRRHTILHRAGPEPCRTDVYAAVYFCPGCGEQALLESPSYQWGQEGECPRCHHKFVVPRDDVLHERPGDRGDAPAFTFACPQCAGTLECETRFAGARVVCRHCRHVIEVPPAGDSVGTAATSAHDPLRAIHDSGLMRCPNPACGQHVPKRGTHCPVCGQAL